MTINSITGGGSPGSGKDSSHLIDGTFIDTSPAPSNPALWENNQVLWGGDYQASQLAGGTNIGWVVLDLGSEIANLDNLYIWNSREPTAGTRDVKDYVIHYASTPTVDKKHRIKKTD